jgi:hypothetical protein
MCFSFSTGSVLNLMPCIGYILMKHAAILLIFLVPFVIGQAQTTESLSYPDSLSLKAKEIKISLVEMQKERARIRSLLIPSLMVAYGFIALETPALRAMDYSIKDEIREDHPHFHTKTDNYLQYVPALMVYATNAIGIHGEHNFHDLTMIYLMANGIAGITVQSLKAITKSPRPNGGHNAFPSGHTATAFVSAEFLRQEYKNVSPVYSYSGYLIATATGILRMYNNAHWLRDIIPGAGFGILSTRIAYWIYPAIQRKLFPHSHAVAFGMPTYEDGNWGASLMYAVQL